MTIAVYVALYAGLFIFLAGCLWRILQYARMPLHLRWELYPVPHEAPERARYGGSYFETGEWWRHTQQHYRCGEWAAMLEEILFIKSLRKHNPRLWLASYLFHTGLYLAIAAAALAGMASLLQFFADGVLFSVLMMLCSAVGAAGAALIVCGACLLLFRRITDAELKNSTHPADIFNLLFFIAAFAVLVLGYLLRAPGTAVLGATARGVVHFDRGLHIGAGFGVGLIATAALAAYVPYTHMAHFIGKYFTWHAVRWDDRRNERGGALEKAITANLACKPTWAAPHMSADGERSWAEIATTNFTREVGQ